MKGVSEYLLSDEYQIQKHKLFQFAYDNEKVPTQKDYSACTMWILEMLVAIGGNRPCALLGIKVGDWENRKSGFCPFNQSEENELVEDDPENDHRKVLKNPFEKPIGCDSEEPTGVLIQSDSDKISVGPPCYIWIPNEFVEIGRAHV